MSNSFGAKIASLYIDGYCTKHLLTVYLRMKRVNKSTILNTNYSISPNLTEVRGGAKMELIFEKQDKRRTRSDMKDKIQNLIKYAYCGVCVVVFFSCQKNLTQFQSSKDLNKSINVTAADTATRVTSYVEGKSVVIDTLTSSLHNGISLLSIKDSDF